MKRFSLMVLAAVLFTTAINVPAMSEDLAAEDEDNITTGLLVKIDEKNLIIFIKENSRIVKFRASYAICREFRARVNSEVEIVFEKSKNNILQILSMKIVEKSSDGTKSFREGENKRVKTKIANPGKPVK